MGKIVYEMSMSLDGYVTAADRSAEEPMGVGGERLHDWAITGGDPQGLALAEVTAKRLGAMITGRKNYEDAIPWWGPNGPSGEARVPLFVLTHRGTPGPEPGSVYTFVTDGVDSLVEQARAAAGDMDIGVSGVEVGRVLLQAGHLDELRIHVVPVLFGDGMRLYEHVGGEHVRLRLVDATSTSTAMHLRYQVLKGKKD